MEKSTFYLRLGYSGYRIIAFGHVERLGELLTVERNWICTELLKRDTYVSPGLEDLAYDLPN